MSFSFVFLDGNDDHVVKRASEAVHRRHQLDADGLRTLGLRVVGRCADLDADLAVLRREDLESDRNLFSDVSVVRKELFGWIFYSSF